MFDGGRLSTGCDAESGQPWKLGQKFLSSWSTAAGKPVVLLVDEVDSLIGDSLISGLRQLRSGYELRPADFPQSVILCGVRDVRDYRIRSSAEGRT